MMIKKVTTIFSLIALHFSLALPAHAQSINPCPRGGGGQFGTLCGYDASTLGDIIRNGITILFIVATIAALFFLVFGGIKWITSGGDKAGVESARNMIVAALVGLVIAFLAYFIVQIIFQLFGLDFAGGDFWASLSLFN